MATQITTVRGSRLDLSFGAPARAGGPELRNSLPPIEGVSRPALPAAPAPALAPEPEYTPPDENLPIQRVVIRIDWCRLAVARGVAPEVSRAVLAWRTAGRTPEATETLREALDDIAFRAMADREISALAWIEMHPSRPGGRSIQVSIATANSGTFEDGGRLIIPGRAEDVRDIDRPFIVHRGDIEQFERENPGVRVLMYA